MSIPIYDCVFITTFYEHIYILLTIKCYSKWKTKRSKTTGTKIRICKVVNVSMCYVERL